MSKKFSHGKISPRMSKLDIVTLARELWAYQVYEYEGKFPQKNLTFVQALVIVLNYEPIKLDAIGRPIFKDSRIARDWLTLMGRPYGPTPKIEFVDLVHPEIFNGNIRTYTTVLRGYY